MHGTTHVERGRHAETLAAAALALQGYEILERNFRYSRLEIDLIARRGDLLVFVEVKFRERPRKGGAVGAVTREKRLDVETAAVGYVKMKELRGARIRFDVIAVEPARGSGASILIRHIPGAFRASGRYRM